MYFIFDFFVKLIEAAIGYRIYFLFDLFVKLIKAAFGYRMNFIFDFFKADRFCCWL
jgi:hypothetical protein